MKVFGIDTTRKIAKVFVVDLDNKENDLILSLDENIKHSEGLFLYIEKILFETKLTLDNFDYYCGVVGPGSFTGIRVGMSTLKGINKVFNKEIISLNAFEIIKTRVKNGIILLNSTMSSCYYAKIKNNNIEDVGVIDKSNIEGFANGEKIYCLLEEQNLINLEYKDINTINDFESLYREAIITKLKNSQTDDFVPYYLQLSQAERNLKSE